MRKSAQTEQVNEVNLLCFSLTWQVSLVVFSVIDVISRRMCFLLLHSVLRASSGARILWMKRKILGLLSRSTSRDFRHLVKVLFYISLNCYTNLYNLISGDIPFEDLSTAETVKDSSLASTPSEKKTSIMGTISGDFNHSFDS